MEGSATGFLGVEGNWTVILGGDGVVLIEESSVDGHLEGADSINLSVDLHLSVIGGNPTELWDGDVSTILVDISVNIFVNGISDS